MGRGGRLRSDLALAYLISKRYNEFRKNIALRVSFEALLEDVSKESLVVINRKMDVLSIWVPLQMLCHTP